MASKNPKRISEVLLPPIGDHEALVLPSYISLEHIVRSCSASIDFGSSSKQFRNEWILLFMCDHSTNLIGSIFWHTISSKFLNEPDFTEYASSRMAESFRALYSAVPKAMKKHFFPEYPSVVTQAIVFGLFLAFPKSRELLSDAFQMKLLEENFARLSGWVPRGLSCDTWRMNLGNKEFRVSSGKGFPIRDIEMLNSVTGVSPVLRKYISMHRSCDALPFSRTRNYDAHSFDRRQRAVTSTEAMNTNLVSAGMLSWKIAISQIEEERLRLEKRFRALDPQAMSRLAAYILIPYTQKTR